MHELTPRREPFGFGHGEQLRFVAFPFDIANRRQGHAVSTERTPDRHKVHQAHEEIAHAAGPAADIGHLSEHNLELVHHLLPNSVEVSELRPLAQHGFGKVETLAQGGFHRAAARLVERMNFSHNNVPARSSSVLRIGLAIYR